MNKELFYLIMAALGGYAAYLAIKEHYQKNNKFQGDLMAGGFSNYGEYDFFGGTRFQKSLNDPDYFVKTNLLGAL